MDVLIGIAAPVFWGLVLFSTLVFVHEGGHFIAARLCGVRVTEFFIGMPCRFNLHHVSRRIGTKFGVTPLLFGGYAAICGMDPTEAPCADRVLGYIHRAGAASVDRIAEDLSLPLEDVEAACALLLGWGSVAPRYDEARGEKPSGRYYPSAYAAQPRDDQGNTRLDGKLFDAAHATAEGEPWVPSMDDASFFARERSRTYIGQGFWKRAAMLVAGIAVNIVTGFALVVAVYSVLGFSVAVDSNVLGGIVAGSPAQAAGIERNERIVAVEGEDVDTWTDILGALEPYDPGDTVILSVAREDAWPEQPSLQSGASSGASVREVQVELGDDGMIGIEATQVTERLPVADSIGLAVSNIASTAQAVVQLITPSHTMEVLQNSTSVVGISVMSSQAAAAGPATFLNFAALISFSLAFMNLLPIPPLDGGKLLVEAVQALTRRKVPLSVQTGLSIAGMALIMILFVYMLGSDIVRFL